MVWDVYIHFDVLILFSRWWFQLFLIFITYLRKWSNLTNIFRTCWNLQLVMFFFHAAPFFFAVCLFWGSLLQQHPGSKPFDEWEADGTGTGRGLKTRSGEVIQWDPYIQGNLYKPFPPNRESYPKCPQIRLRMFFINCPDICLGNQTRSKSMVIFFVWFAPKK